MTDLDAAVIRWRDAREAIFRSAVTDDNTKLWSELGRAELNLMQMARRLVK